jgi:predicted SAM-dependent methyltransferase
MNFLNIGCGSIFHPSWINLDIAPSSQDVIGWDFRNGIPYHDNYFEACYSSHVIEHLTTSEAIFLINEAFRSLKSGGIFRVAVPDLETIVRNYIHFFEQSVVGINEAIPNYDWMMLELYDQVVREVSGGEMAKYIRNSNLPNKDYIQLRIGYELDTILRSQSDIITQSFWKKIKHLKPSQISKLLHDFRNSLARKLVVLVAGVEAGQAFDEGLFRRSGEIHRWMYDKFSLHRLLSQSRFTSIQVCQADESLIPNFNEYCLDTFNGQVRKPDSLFMEGVKP